MSIEAWKLKEEETKRKEISEKEKKQEVKKVLQYKKTKETIWVEIEADKSLNNLKELVQKWVIKEETAQKIISWKNLEEETIVKIFEKIEEVESIKSISKYLPKEFRITKEEYSKALHSNDFRKKTLVKLDEALTILANQANPDWLMWLNLFSWFLTVLDKNLILIQEHNIDMKDNLKNMDLWKEKKLSIWERFIVFLKELFVN
jgi:hypothetical protein